MKCEKKQVSESDILAAILKVKPTCDMPRPKGKPGKCKPLKPKKGDN